MRVTAPISLSPTPVVAVAGPTGSGKSRLAFELAGKLNGEIVNCDSLQIYRGFDIGTAKPSRFEQASIPHHMIDIAGPGEEFSAGEFARRARETISAIADRGKLPVVAGGTGFYLKALVDGLVEGPRADAGIRARLRRIEERRPGRLHAILTRWDAAAALRIHASDVQKLVRAIELMLLESEALSSVHARPRAAAAHLRILQIGLDPPRPALYARLDERSRRMFEGGLLDEVRGLLAKGVPPSAKPFGAIGYKQALAVLERRMDPEGALAEMQRDTRRYAKRQWTWFRRDPRVYWIQRFGDAPEALDRAIRLLYKRLFWY